ncbi:hypothetical protein [Actinokineospora globicatena]|uniref:Secreted protein n=1 Tax=Actinokineospora globicatena TaxID=103729 RepID=A0A9W6V8G1_9PSEU|nr:hypothetical protein [Actinokineospora globicatena]MCP2303570.1 hypothetical protein [Actinokineospora globicatena]GLW79293.1 hypothetical protein Aglo01_37750 [Actinokineospora globicatena]GLW86297.1 hypothetical protein Aglo02_39360 [Actinokineospora globicatena]GLW89913.1 hypothetical protein Aglo03_07290 [Actinokineospora globicatena]
MSARTTFAAAAVFAAGLSALITTPAMASGPTVGVDLDTNFGGGVNAANNWNFTAAAVCLQEVAVVPVLGDYVSDHVNNCSNGNVIDHSGK